IFYRLVERADALMHNYRPGAPEKLGLDYESVAPVNPRLVYLYAGSYGSTGPRSRLPAFHPTLSAITGSGFLLSGEGNPPMDSMQGDPDGALGVATTLLMGLQARARTGRGQRMETRMIQSGAYAVSDEFLDYAGKPPQRLPDAGQHGFHALYRLYDTGRGWLMLACPREREWRALCVALGHEDWLSDARFASAEARRANDAALAAAIEAALRDRSAEDWESYFRAHGVPGVRADGPRWNVFLHTDPGAAANGLRAMA